MPWGKLDDSLYDHPKLDRLGRDRLAGTGLWALSISWCNKRLTDGHLTADRVRQLGGSVRLAERLADAGLFDRTPDGYVVHDFLDFNDSRADIERRREAERAKKKAQREAGHKATDHGPDGRFVSHRDTDRDGQEESPATRPVPSPPDPDKPPNPPRGGGRRSNGTSPRQLAAKEREAERERARRNQLEATQVRIHENGGHYEVPNAICPRCREGAA